MPSLSTVLPALLAVRALDPNPTSTAWPFICRELLRDEPPRERRADIDQHLLDAIQAATPEERKGSAFARGALDRPYWRAVEECLERGELPWRKGRGVVEGLKAQDEDRIQEIDQELARLSTVLASAAASASEKSEILSDFLFTRLSPQDVRPLLSLRTTQGSCLDLFPPSLQECVSTFTRTHVKPGAKIRGKSSILTVGAKALSKHWHRDRTVGFWRVCTGSERQKNEAANLVLADILTGAVWVNLHWLPHDILAYEIRNSQGYGARWEAHAPATSTSPSIPPLSATAEGSFPEDHSHETGVEPEVEGASVKENLGPGKNVESPWAFRGFLEPQMEGGHEVGWVH